MLDFSWQTYVMIGLAIALLVALEGGYRINKGKE
jgi:hypothetical protein